MHPKVFMVIDLRNGCGSRVVVVQIRVVTALKWLRFDAFHYQWHHRHSWRVRMPKKDFGLVCDLGQGPGAPGNPRHARHGRKEEEKNNRNNL